MKLVDVNTIKYMSVISDGTPAGTKILTSDGEELNNVTKAVIILEGGQVPKLVIETVLPKMNIELPMIVQGEAPSVQEPQKN